MTLQRATLELDADVDGDGTNEAGVFHMVGNVQIEQNVTPRSIIDGSRFQRVNTAVQELLSEGKAARQGAYVDLGAGSHTVEVNFVGWEGAKDPELGGDLQWGDGSGSPGSPTKADATGCDPMTQMQVFNRYLQVGRHDSFHPGHLYVGEYSTGKYTDSAGVYSDYAPLTVAVVPSQGVRTTDSPESYDGSLTLVEIIALDRDYDATSREEWK